MIKIFKKKPMVLTKDWAWARVAGKPEAGLILSLPQDAVLVDMDDQPDELPSCICGGALEDPLTMASNMSVSQALDKCQCPLILLPGNIIRLKGDPKDLIHAECGKRLNYYRNSDGQVPEKE